MEAAGDRDWMQFRQGQALAYSLAHLTATGFHQPKKMPKFDKVFPDRKTAAAADQAPDEAARNMDYWMRAMALFNTKGATPQ